MNRSRKALIRAYKQGYRVVGDKIVSPHTGKFVKLSNNSNGYPRFAYRVQSGSGKISLSVHRLVAYQKYGDKMFEPGIQVRHLDNNKKNFSLGNIAIGTASENTMDMPEKQRVERARKGMIAAAKVCRKWSNIELAFIRKRYSEIRSYKIVMEEFNITSKGTLHYILNNEYFIE